MIPDVWNGDPRLCKISHQKRLSKNVYHCLVTKTMVAIHVHQNNFLLGVDAKTQKQTQYIFLL